MKESITKFDLEAAFKALDEIDVPAADKVKANRPALTEIFSNKTKFDTLMEEYYDISDMGDLDEAKADREAEVAKAKLERIEKIVDLDAESPEDLLTSYVGKYIIQCPQCMTLFYKNPEDVVEDEEDQNTVNVNEVCQHCGNESGYTLIGKVGEAEPGEFTEEAPELDTAVEETPEEEPTEEPAEEGTEDMGDLDALDLDLDLDEEPEKTEEAFSVHGSESLVEELSDDADLDAKLEAHNEYIEYLRTAIAQEEEKLEKADNEQVKVAIQRNIDAFKADLENALPDAVKNDTAIAEEPVEEIEAELEPEVQGETEVQEESCAAPVENTVLTEELHEEAGLDVSAEEFEELINSPEFKKPISDAAARAMLDAEKESDEDKDDTVEESIAADNDILEEGIFDKVKNGLSKAKDKFTKFLDTQLKSRASAADWLLKSALEDYSAASVNDDGSVAAAVDNRKFTKFIVIGYADTDTSGKKLKVAPAYNSTALVKKQKYPEVKDTYADAEKVAKGWSMIDGNGPAFVYLAKTDKGDGAAFLCQYFNGAVDEKSDQLNKYLDTVRRSLTGSKLQAKGGTDQSDTRKVKADAVKPGMKIKLPNGNEIEVTSAEKVTDAFGDEMYSIAAKNAEGTESTFSKAATYEFTVARDSIKNESLDTFMAGLDELQESTLETLIANSLVEAYGNVAGFKLTDCAYSDSKFTVDGTIYFTSGNTRKTTYAFTESVETNGKVSLHGLNEKLGKDKQFTLTGHTDNNKTFIAESFTYTKK